MINETNNHSILIKLDSHYATRYDMATGVATFEIAEPININPQLYIILRIKYLETANMFKNINNNNNLFAYEIGGEEYAMAIAPDDYNILELIEDVQNETGINITYDEQANKVAFSAPGPFRVKASSTCLDLFGFISKNGDFVAEYDPAALLYKLKPSGFVNLSGLNHFYISSNISTKNLGTNGQRTNILDVIPIGVPFGNMILYNNSGGHYNMIYDKFINFIEIKFLNRFDQPISMEDNHFLIILEVSTTSHKKIDFEDLLLDSLDPKK